MLNAKSLVDVLTDPKKSNWFKLFPVIIPATGKSFEGKLVPQNPSDKPSEKLLERIRAAKGKLEKKEKIDKKVKTPKKKTQLA